MVIDTVIFDLDGTITEPFLDFDAIRTEMGLEPNQGMILELMKKMDDAQLAHAHEVLAKHEAMAVENSTLNDGAKETIDELRKRGINIGILTRNTRSNTLAVQEKHGLRFDAIIGREDGPPKPDAFGVLSLCEQFNTKPAQAMVVGDFLHDLISAKAAGATAVLINNHKDADEFSKYADYTVDSLNEILDIVAKG
jgi:HAD superfamily hydrolase (TIGR01509 family)